VGICGGPLRGSDLRPHFCLALNKGERVWVSQLGTLLVRISYTNKKEKMEGGKYATKNGGGRAQQHTLNKL